MGYMTDHPDINALAARLRRLSNTPGMGVVGAGISCVVERDIQQAMCDAAEALEHVLAERDDLRDVATSAEALVYVPGAWRCAKCGLRLIATVLHPEGMSANEAPQQCVNGCGPMWRVTERADRQDAQRSFNAKCEEAEALKAALDRSVEPDRLARAESTTKEG
jgi:hypothetical protein